MIGLFAFFYAVLHMLTWVVFIHYFDVKFMIEDVVKRPFITVGMTTFLILFVLALTSNRFSLRKLGRKWGNAPPTGVRGGDWRHAAFLAAGQSRHHRALALGRGLCGALCVSSLVGVPTSPCGEVFFNSQRPTPNAQLLPIANFQELPKLKVVGS